MRGFSEGPLSPSERRDLVAVVLVSGASRRRARAPAGSSAATPARNGRPGTSLRLYGLLDKARARGRRRALLAIARGESARPARRGPRAPLTASRPSMPPARGEGPPFRRAAQRRPCLRRPRVGRMFSSSTGGWWPHLTRRDTELAGRRSRDPAVPAGRKRIPGPLPLAQLSHRHPALRGPPSRQQVHDRRLELGGVFVPIPVDLP